ncbi:MAG TPA: alpha-1,4-glucan--maltose-1-phosphate maltosyltransferase [Flavipsychrobacter sp.]|nr:alpha-1,4-glucan--maltose-1-phosphate maltosyltransferase [Flavipsychrobacter sp.]
MTDIAGRKRVIIGNVMPTVECGQFPAKAIINTSVIISADVFTDGHDKLAAFILIKCSSDKNWKELELEFTTNDRWEVPFVPDKIGVYQFNISGWIDHYTTWRESVLKKYNAQQDIVTDLKAGIQIADGAIAKAKGKNKEILSKWADELGYVADNASGIELVKDKMIGEILRKYIDKDRITTSETFEIIIDRKKAEFSTWYELFPRSAGSESGKHGTFNDVKKLLPLIAKWGFDILYLPPIHPIGFTHRKGKNNSLTALKDDPGSPWAIGNKKGGHKAIHSELGQLKDFKSLVNESKKHDIEIAMDIAFQCSPDHPYVKEHPAWFKWRADGTVQFAENPPKKYEDIIPFDFESRDWMGLWEELKNIIKFWIEKGVTIFRVDNPHTKAFSFWEWMIPEIKQQYPEVIFLAEAFTRPRIMERLAKIGFTQSYTYFTWRNAKWELIEYINELTKTERRYYFRPNFWPNTPDILAPELVVGGENAHVIRLLLAATLSSNYGLYGPVYELGINEPMAGKEEYIHNEKYEIKRWDWTGYTKIREIILRINKIRHENAALQTTWNIEFAETNNDNIICYVKYDDSRSNIIIVAINLDPHNVQSANVKLPLKVMNIEQGDTYTVHDLLSGDKYIWYAEWNYVRLNPYDIPGHVFKVIK